MTASLHAVHTVFVCQLISFLTPYNLLQITLERVGEKEDRIKMETA